MSRDGRDRLRECCELFARELRDIIVMSDLDTDSLMVASTNLDDPHLNPPHALQICAINRCSILDVHLHGNHGSDLQLLRWIILACWTFSQIAPPNMSAVTILPRGL